MRGKRKKKDNDLQIQPKRVNFRNNFDLLAFFNCWENKRNYKTTEEIPKTTTNQQKTNKEQTENSLNDLHTKSPMKEAFDEPIPRILKRNLLLML